MKKPLLFLVNDEPAVLETLAAAVQSQFQADYQLQTAVSGEAALAQLQAHRQAEELVALLLADQQMPGMSGVAFLAEASKLYPQARKVLLSDFADSEAAIQSINEVGIHRYLVLPWTPPEERLFPALAELLHEWQTAVRLPALCVRVIMSNQVARIRHDSDLHHAAEIVALSGIGDLMVTDDAGNFVGVLSEGDILRAALPDFDEILEEGGTLQDAYYLFLRKGQALSGRSIMPLVIHNPLVLHPDDHVAKAATVLINRQIRRLPVVENGRLIGVVSRANICQAVVGGW